MPQHSLNNIWIDGFRGLRDLSIEGLGRLNILVGENNSGKTSVLEALSILCNPYDPAEWLAMVRRRDFGGLDETRIQSLRWCFQQTGQLWDPEYTFQSTCVMNCSGIFPLRKLVVEYKDIVGEPSQKQIERMIRFGRRGGDALEMEERWRGAELIHFVEIDDSPNMSSIFRSSTHSSIEPIMMQVWEEDPMMGRPIRPRRKGNLPTDTLTPYSYQLNRLQVRAHSQQLFQSLSDPTNNKDYILEIISQFDPDIVDIKIASFRGGRPAIYLNHKRMGPAPLTVFGDALRRVVLLASTLHMLKGGGLLLIDEIETGIHISAQKRVFDWLARTARHFDVQIVATTHSLEAVDAIALSVSNQIDDLVTFHLDQTENQTRVKRISGDLLLRLRRERGLDVR